MKQYWQRQSIQSARGHIRIAVLLLVVLGLLLLPGYALRPDGPFYNVSDMSFSSINAAVFDNINSELFFVGEHHDNPHHHAVQLAVIREIHEKAEKPLAIGLEMFETGYQKQLDQWVDGDLSLDNFIKVYYKNWDQNWPLYSDILLYAREHKIPLVALNIPRNIVRKVAQQGFGSLTAEDMSALPSGVTCDVGPEYRNFIERVFGWHGNHKGSFNNFCEAQVLWDTVMAINLLHFKERHPDMKIVVLAGDGHSWKPGIPRQIKMRQDLPTTVFLPESPKLNRGNVTQADTDYLWLLDLEQ